MTREWRPGDVAMVTLVDGREVIAMRDAHGKGWGITVRPDHVPDLTVVDARPLVIIDAEDREQVGRLAKILGRLKRESGNNKASLTTALREFADPKPVEVFEHFVVRTGVEHLYTKGNREPYRSVCGKTWYPSDKTVATQKCPDCSEIVGGMWTK